MTTRTIERPAARDNVVAPLADADPNPRGAKRFTVDGRDPLEGWLEKFCERIRQDVQALLPARRLEAVLLGGGYGRGEGGVLRVGAEDRPYNDLDLYVCLRGRNLLFGRSYQAALDALGHLLSVAAGVEVEFKVMSLARLRREPVSMFSCDLVAGHRWLLGDERLLKDCERHRHAENIPLAEATRLLMNRCSGLLFARERLRREPFTVEDADFVQRNIAKAQLACGDGVLTACRQYHSSCQERHRKLLRLEPQGTVSWLSEVRRHHVQGVQFKLRPALPAATRKELCIQHGEVTALAREIWLWVESRRLNRAFTSVRDYALSKLNKCPETRPWRNGLITLLRLGPAALFNGMATHYARERLYHALPLLLWDSSGLSDPRLLRAIQSELITTTAQPANLIRAYESLWQRFR